MEIMQTRADLVSSRTPGSLALPLPLVQCKLATGRKTNYELSSWQSLLFETSSFCNMELKE